MNKNKDKEKENNNFLKKIKTILIYILLILVIIYIGVIIGYSVIGNGKFIDALDLTAIKHIINIIFN